ncbi:type II toxin-antitoxin system HigB family toxin [Chlorogloeopsis fritschii PCC 9212]|uniref:Type II toxin-antitoxin system HigB family toxin n=1 Tax=Chlorogloeopsis fritschii PCC 6912 TaxID=211165 RepID=A0A433MX70_CHLFR|nr:type II toxin-antitoxin system HigB family toxin [Chlorogloeopsis fritschii]RUR72728.1 hypothetical protein PCC6912_61030 [Chlorogloeopsis fritschii PCC 6912]
MHVISFKTLREYAEIHADSKEALSNWYKVSSKAKWSNLVEVQKVFPKAELSVILRFSISKEINTV